MIVLEGRPYTKKNHGQVIVRGGKRFHVQSDTYHAYETECCLTLRNCPEHYEGDVIMKALYYLPHKGGMPDLVGLLQGTCDILEKGGVVDNDRQIVGFDGSRIAGFDRLNPRTEIVLEPVRA